MSQYVSAHTRTDTYLCELSAFKCIQGESKNERDAHRETKTENHVHRRG